ncbi:MAG: ABC transporter permease [Flavipsychrobacter sp.]|nr:ABC transporter permease [Flavipsychrobacter sp.]
MNRTLTWQIMLRYFKGKGTANVAPLLSRISMVAIAVVSCAMIILLSVFNGMGELVTSHYKGFYPDMRIVPAKGKFFSLPAGQMQQIAGLQGIAVATPTIEDNVLMNNQGNDNQVITIKGVSNDYFKVSDISDYIYDGNKLLSTGGTPTAIVGNLIMDRMGMDLHHGINNITVHYPNVNNTNPAADPASAFTSLNVVPEGRFAIMDEFDDKYLLASLPLVQDLLQAPGKYSAIEIKLTPGANTNRLKEELQRITGDAYRTETRYEQNKTLYMVMTVEKWAIYAILVLVLIIASFNMIGALSLLAMEKQKDIAILRVMGADNNSIRNIFLGEGILWTLFGGLCGLLPGLLLLLGQQQFSWIKLEGFIVDAYPVHIQPADVLLILVTMILVGFLASWKPARKAASQQLAGLKS